MALGKPDAGKPPVRFDEGRSETVIGLVPFNPSAPPTLLRACLKIPRGAVFVQKVGWRGATKEHTPCGSSTEEQRSQTTFCTKTLWAAVLLSFARVSSVGTARFGDAPPSPPWPKPKSLAAAP